jgi:pSer/pThr/pTyr-binding forkhead associated (FHA) protein
MNLSLVVSAGKKQGKVIPILSSPFFIGRSPECQLRPASVLISKRHCAVLIRDSQALIHDFDSTNGTFVNGEPVRGEHQLLDGDHLKIGPLEFRIALQTVPGASEPIPVPTSRSSVDEEAAAALLLSSQDQQPASANLEQLPAESTIVESRQGPFDTQLPPEQKLEQESRHSRAASRAAAAKSASGNTSAAALAILERYRRRPRG